MPLYITCLEEFQKATKIESSPFLLGSSNLQLMCSSDWKSQVIDPYDNLLQDFFELKNPGVDDVPYLLLPNGCPTLIFILDPLFPRSFLCGPLTTARRIIIPAKGAIFCVRLKPGRIDWLVKEAGFKFANEVVPLYKYIVEADDFARLLCRLVSYEQRCQVLLSFLGRNGAEKYCVDPIIQECIKLIHESKGMRHIYDIATAVSRSERFLSRCFRDKVGVSSKTYCEIIKFQHSVYSLVTTYPSTLGSVARTHGYYDLPHMNRSYKRFLNYTANEIKHLDMESIYVLDLFCDNSTRVINQ